MCGRVVAAEAEHVEAFGRSDGGDRVSELEQERLELEELVEVEVPDDLFTVIHRSNQDVATQEDTASLVVRKLGQECYVAAVPPDDLGRHGGVPADDRADEARRRPHPLFVEAEIEREPL
jgi:hypothetical protein